jgi:hypothetical protein
MQIDAIRPRRLVKSNTSNVPNRKPRMAERPWERISVLTLAMKSRLYHALLDLPPVTDISRLKLTVARIAPSSPTLLAWIMGRTP